MVLNKGLTRIRLGKRGDVAWILEGCWGYRKRCHHVMGIKPQKFQIKSRIINIVCAHGTSEGDKSDGHHNRLTLRFVLPLLQDVRGVGLISLILVVNVMRLAKKVMDAVIASINLPEEEELSQHWVQWIDEVYRGLEETNNQAMESAERLDTSLKAAVDDVRRGIDWINCELSHDAEIGAEKWNDMVSELKTHSPSTGISSEETIRQSESSKGIPDKLSLSSMVYSSVTSEPEQSKIDQKEEELLSIMTVNSQKVSEDTSIIPYKSDSEVRHDGTPSSKPLSFGSEDESPGDDDDNTNTNTVSSHKPEQEQKKDPIIADMMQTGQHVSMLSSPIGYHGMSRDKRGTESLGADVKRVATTANRISNAPKSSTNMPSELDDNRTHDAVGGNGGDVGHGNGDSGGSGGGWGRSGDDDGDFDNGNHFNFSLILMLTVAFAYLAFIASKWRNSSAVRKSN